LGNINIKKQINRGKKEKNKHTKFSFFDIENIKMKTLISAILIVSLFVLSVHAYDYATEVAKATVCASKLDTALTACNSNTACNNAR